MVKKGRLWKIDVYLSVYIQYARHMRTRDVGSDLVRREEIVEERERERQYDRHLRTRDMSRDFVRGEEIVEERERQYDRHLRTKNVSKDFILNES